MSLKFVVRKLEGHSLQEGEEEKKGGGQQQQQQQQQLPHAAFSSTVSQQAKHLEK